MQKRGQWLVSGVLWSLSCIACDSPAPDLKEWTVEDHDHQVEASSRRRSGGGKHRAPSRSDQLIAVTWQKQCVRCHGKRGRGDGPEGRMFKTRDLTDPAWQTMVTDDALKKVIKEGRDKMPAFDLPDRTIEGLVAHVRKLQRRRPRTETQPAGVKTPAEGAEGEASTSMPSPSGSSPH